MRSRPIRLIISSAAAIAAALLVSGAMLAHGGETVFVAEPATVAPGGGVAVRADLLAPGPVRLTLVGSDGTRHVVGVIEQTDQGHFDVLVTIPVDLPTGFWTLVAEAAGTTIASAIVDVAGTPVGVEEGGQGERDEDDPLLAPLPPGWRASRSSAPEPAVGAVRSAPGTTSVDVVPLVALAAAIGALALLYVRTGRRAAPRDAADHGP